LKLPNYERAVVPQKKITEYLLLSGLLKPETKLPG